MLRRWLSEVRYRFRAIFRRSRVERELDDELRYHLEREAEKYVRQGMNARDAMRRARLAFGGLEQTKEEARDARGISLVDVVARDARYALHGLKASPGFSAAVVLTLALGIGGTTAVFSAVDAVLLKPLPFQSPGQLVRIYSASVQRPDGENFVTPVHFLAYRQPTPSLQAIGALNTYDATGGDIGTANDVRRIRTLTVSADYFDVLRVHPAIGRGFTRAEENGPPTDQGVGAYVIVLSHHLWEERFGGNPGALGRTLTVSGEPYTVIGVMPEGFADPIVGHGVDAWIPLDLTTGRDMANISNHWLTLIGRLRPGVSPQQAQADLDVLTRRLTAPYPGSRNDRTHVVPLKADVVGAASHSLELMLGAVGLVLLLVCVNVANLQLVRATERSTEFAMRSALGAGSRRLAGQLLTESLVLAAVGTLAGLVVARLAMSALEALGASSIPRLAGLTLDLRVLAFAAVIAAASAVLFGMVPAWHAARTDPADVLRGSGRANTGDRARGRLRTGLVVTQVALAFVLLAGAGMLFASFRAVKETPLGFASDHVLTFRMHLPEARYDSTARAVLYTRFNAAVEALPGVTAAGGVSWLPATGDYHSWGTTALSGPLAGTRRAQTQADNRIITPDYFRALGIPMLAGRAFDARDGPGTPDRVIVSKDLAERLYPGVDPLGQTLVTGGRRATIIGVVPDVAVNPEGRIVPHVYHVHAQFAGDRNWALFEAIAGGGSPTALIPTVRRTLHGIDPLLVMDQPTPLGDVIGRGTAERKFTMILLLAFAGTALVLAVLGIFGVFSYVVRLRGAEFGIRIALGATPRAVLGPVMRQGAAVIGTGLVLGLLGAAATSRVLASMVFHVSPLDPRALVLAGLVLAAGGGGAAYLPARRAARADPRSTLE
ncbi:MAG TPA: ABC transporter permease [Gemmatimonadales bacterium]|nr:ABC transporter permease [Gemmatimonadales bacterium]